MLEDRTVPSTFWVTNRNDAGAGSLRQAVLDSNSHAGADVIKFRHSAEGTITLTSGEMSVTGELRIDGPGSNRETVSGGGTSRVFNVASGVSVRIDDLTIANGQAATGGGILNAGTLSLNDSVVSGCSAGSGGGIANTGNLAVNHSTITGNAGYGGGGLFNTGGGTAVLHRATFCGNTGHDAAGITNWFGSTLTIQNSLITENQADEFGTGAIVSAGPLNIFNTTISENSGSIPALWLIGDETVDVVISGSRIVRNRLGPPGPPLEFAPITTHSHLRIEDTIISENIGDQAGAMMVEGPTEIVNSTISGNLGGANDPYSAGAIVSFGQLSVVGSTISDNTGAKTGGIYDLFGYGLEITCSTISGNKAIPLAEAQFPTSAGGLVTYGPTTINNSTISGNAVLADGMVANNSYSLAGGGIVAYYSSLNIDHSTIAFNTVSNAPDGLGQVSGGVVGANNFFPADISVRNSIVASNTATGYDPDVNGSFQSQGHNLIGVLTANATGFVASDLHGTMALPLDPRLKALGRNGGRTMTHALRPDSPALNAGDNADAPPTDQRGRTRIVGGTIDIGAYEASFGGGDCGPMVGMSTNPDSGRPDKLVVAAIGGVPWRRKPEIRTPTSSDEQFGSKLEVPIWHGMDLGSKRATPQQPLDCTLARHELDLDHAVFVGSLT